DTFHAGDLLTYGLGHRGSFGIRLTDSAIFDPLNEANVTSVHLSPPLVWPIPPQRKGEQDSVAFIITSESDYIPMDGYWFKNGRTRHAFYAKAIFDSRGDSLLINDGKSIHRFGLEETACVGDLYQGVTVKLTQPKQRIPFAGPQAMLAVVMLGVLFIALCCGEERHKVKTSRAWTIVWASTLVLLFVRFVLAYRVSLIPPADASELELQNVFHKSLTVSLVGLVAIPMALIFSRTFIAIRDSGLARLKWQVLLYEATVVGFVIWLAWLVGFDPFTFQAVLLIVAAVSLPVLFAKLRVIGARNYFRKFLAHPSAFYMPAAVSILWMIFGHLLGRNESFLGFRLSIMTHILVVLTVALGARGLLTSKKHSTVKRALVAGAGIFAAITVIVLIQFGLNRSGRGLAFTLVGLVLAGICIRTLSLPAIRMWLLKPFYYHRWLFALYIVLCLLMEVFVIRDKGFFIYGLSFSLAVVIALYYDRSSRIRGYLLSIGLAALFLALFSFPKYLSVTGIITKVVKPNNSIFYRFMALQDSEEEVLLAEYGENRLQKTPFLRNSHHQWQMLLYAAHSDGSGLGYARAPLTDSGMTYPTSMTDCVYSIYLLSEHGWMSGLLLIFVYFIAGGACFLIASRIPADNRVNFRLVALVTIGGFLMFNALYMAAANIGQLI
ncbi:hypothetical protein MJD09_05820, partial [bacterium]|nr:hypothetical protein [bacterium]